MRDSTEARWCPCRGCVSGQCCRVHWPVKEICSGVILYGHGHNPLLCQEKPFSWEGLRLEKARAVRYSENLGVGAGGHSSGLHSFASMNITSVPAYSPLHGSYDKQDLARCQVQFVS